MFRTVSLSVIRSCQQAVSITCMTYTIAVCTVLESWRWTEILSETCRDQFQKQIWEISASHWFYYKNISRCIVLRMSNLTFCWWLYGKFVCETYEKSLTARIMYRKKNTLFTDKYVGAKMDSTKRKEVFPHTNYSSFNTRSRITAQCTV